MTFEEFKRICYHTYKSIRIPGSSTVVDKTALMTKGKYDFDKENKVLRKVYEQEDYVNK